MSIIITGIGYSQETTVDILGNQTLEDYYALEQNANGQVIGIDLQNGLYSNLGPNPGTDWGFKGLSYQTSPSLGVTGAEAVFQSISTGAIVDWNIDPFSGQVIGGGELALNPGPSWHLIDPEADFNGDGQSDLLFQNASTGQVDIWDMNGSSVIGGGVVGLTPGANWKAVTTVDANGDGKSDIVWQNTSNGQVAVWEMDGNNVIGGGLVGPAPGAGWTLQTALNSGGGYFNLDFQDKATNQAAIWGVHGTTPVSGTVMPFDSFETILGSSVNSTGGMSSYFEDMSNNLHVQTSTASSVISGYSGTPVAWTIGPHQW
jgi:hypothetical protein